MELGSIVKMTEFQRENNEVLKYILEERFFSKFTPDYLAQQSFNGLNIELFITPVCNQACEYCYLIRHSDGLYPKEKEKFKNLNGIFVRKKICHS